jgi:V/A-type H+-transporting ATPase subunit E
MELELKELVTRIRREGVDEARAEADRILSEARDQARAIVEKAAADAESLKREAEAQARRLEEAGLAALEQAARNLTLGFKKELEAMLKELVAQASKEALSGASFESIVAEVCKAWAGGKQGGLELLVPEGKAEELAKKALSSLAASLREGVTIRPSAGVKAGFRIVEKEGSVGFDFKPDELAELFSRFLSPKLKGVMERAVGRAGA